MTLVLKDAYEKLGNILDNGIRIVHTINGFKLSDTKTKRYNIVSEKTDIEILKENNDLNFPSVEVLTTEGDILTFSKRNFDTLFQI